MPLLAIPVAVLLSLASFVGFYKYLPLSWLDGNSAPLVGTSITTILGSDTLSSSRTTINNNFTALNSGKLETTVTSVPTITTLAGLTTASSLSTVGTISGGVWNATAIGVSKGGTGTTTLSANQILLGNGASGFTTTNGWGSSGQLLTSAGNGVAPTWSSASFDTTVSYNLTGPSILIKNLSASSTVANPLALNGVNYSFPSSIQASSTFLTTSASGAVLWEYPNPRTLQADTTGYSTSATATTTLATYVLPANTLSLNDSLLITIITTRTNGASNIDYYSVDFGNGSATTTLINSGDAGNKSRSDITITNAGSLSSQLSITDMYSDSTTQSMVYANPVVNTGAQAYIAVKGRVTTGTDTLHLKGFRVELKQFK